MRCTLLASLLVLAAWPNMTLAEGKKYFIGIGVNEYDHAKLEKLRFAENDILEAGQLFGDSGYTVTLLTTTVGPLRNDPKDVRRQPVTALVPTKVNIDRALKAVLAQCKKDDILVCAFAGHGMQFDEDTGAYFCPVDAKPFKDDKDTLISLEDIYKHLDKCGAGAKVLLADCCRNDPDPTRGRSSGEILDKDPPKGVVALFACDRGEKAHENEVLEHGIFFYHLIEGMKGKAANDEGDIEFGLMARHVWRQVPKAVRELTNGTRAQNPVERGGERKGVLVLVSKSDGELRKDWEDYIRSTTTTGFSTLFLKERGPKRADSWKASSEGSTLAMVLYARCLKYGCGVTKDEPEAVELFRRAANLKNARAMNNLGDCYSKGTGVGKDENEAVAWYTKAAQLGDSTSMVDLGVCFMSGEGVTRDEKEALKWFVKASEFGNAHAMNKLGACYYKGNGVGKDEKEAVRWVTKAAELGHSVAMNNLGECYSKGTGVGKNEKEAVKWYTRAAELGNTSAMNNLGVSYSRGIGVEKDEKEAVRWYMKAAELGNTTAMNNLSYYGYANGTGVEKDEKEAVRWYMKAAELGNATAMTNLGKCYYKGTGVTKDAKEAVRWYTKAAELGHSVAMNELGYYCYAKGIGVGKDEKEALKWYTKAAELGNAPAMTNLGSCHEFGFGVGKDVGEAVRWYTKAAELGERNAMCTLGNCYVNGFGVERNVDKAVDWYRKAANLGHEKAKENLKRLGKE